MSSARTFPLLQLATPKPMTIPHWLTDIATTLARWARAERIGRRKYVLVNVLSGAVGFSIIFVPLLLLLFMPDIDLTSALIAHTLVSVVAAIVMLVIFLSTSISRLRDMGVPRTWALAGLVPYLNIIFFLVLALSEGQKARINRKEIYGRKKPEPKEDN